MDDALADHSGEHFPAQEPPRALDLLWKSLRTLEAFEDLMNINDWRWRS